MIPELGIFFDVPMAEYRREEGVNVSALKSMGTSPAHYLAKVQAPPDDPTPAQITGTICHSAVLENDFTGFVVKPSDYDGRTKEGKVWLANQTKLPIDRETASNIAGMVASVRRHPMAGKILYGDGKNEVCCWKVHAATGILLKGRADRVATDSQNKTVVIDLKTTGEGDGKKENFSREISKWGYDIQAAFYMDLFDASYFCFVCVEKVAPFAVSCYSLSPASIAVGRRKYESYLAEINKCVAANSWPAYGDDLDTIDLPDYVMRKENNV